MTPPDLILDVLLAQTSPPHNLSKSDLESTLNLSKLKADERAALNTPLPELTVGSAVGFIISPLGGLIASTTRLIDHGTTSLERYFKVEALAACLNHAGGQTLIADFFSNTVAKREITHAAGSDLSKLVESNDSFKKSADKFEADFKTKYKTVLSRGLASIDLRNLAAEMKAVGGLPAAPSLPFFGIGSPLGILGSFQEISVRLTRWRLLGSNSYMATFRYELFDHFGCDDSDLVGLPTHGTPGQIAMWLLARKPEHGPGHKPYVVKIVVERTVADFVSAP